MQNIFILILGLTSLVSMSYVVFRDFSLVWLKIWMMMGASSCAAYLLTRFFSRLFPFAGRNMILQAGGVLGVCAIMLAAGPLALFLVLWECTRRKPLQSR